MKINITKTLCDICNNEIEKQKNPLETSIEITNKDLCIKCSGYVLNNMIKNKMLDYSLLEEAIKETTREYNSNSNIEWATLNIMD